MKTISTAVVAASLAAASLPAALAIAAPSQMQSGTTDPQISDGSAQRELDAARALWNEQHLSHYRFRVRRTCYCPEELRRERQITVRDGRPVRPNRHVKRLASVTRLFDTVQAAIDAGASSLTVTYDARRGYPREISIDHYEQIADDEEWIAARWLKALGGGREL
jgi:uncharacterized protein DUF6174